MLIYDVDLNWTLPLVSLSIIYVDHVDGLVQMKSKHDELGLSSHVCG